MHLITSDLLSDYYKMHFKSKVIMIFSKKANNKSILY